jgi:hypothetical protein
MQRSRFDRVELQQVIEDEVKEGLANFSILQNICQALIRAKFVVRLLAPRGHKFALNKMH